MMGKTILDGYVGIKFQAICRDQSLPTEAELYVREFQDSGKLLDQYQMAPANGGNISMRWRNGFLITASGSNLSSIEDNEVIFVEQFSIFQANASYYGPLKPSSETFLHGLLYQERPHIQAVIHAHDEVATSMNLAGLLQESEREEPYGTVELAEICLKTFMAQNDLIVLKNHGYVAIGENLAEVTKKIIAMHQNLLQCRIKK